MEILVTGSRTGLGRYLKEYYEADGFERGSEIPDKYYDTIIHCAHDHTDHGANIELTSRILSIPCGKFVYTSSVDVYAALRGEGNEYADAKLYCERYIRESCDNYLILRLGVLLGKYMKRNTLVKMLQGDKVNLSAESTMGFVRYSDVAKAVFSGWGTTDLCGHRYTLGELGSEFGMGGEWGKYTYGTAPVHARLDSKMVIKDFIENDLAAIQG